MTGVRAADGTRVTISPCTAADRIKVELAAYPRVAACPACHDYARDQVAVSSVPTTLAATLAYHDSAHLEDCLTLASQHFG